MSVRGTSPMTTQQPAGGKVLMLDQWELTRICSYLEPIGDDGFFFYLSNGTFQTGGFFMPYKNYQKRDEISAAGHVWLVNECDLQKTEEPKEEVFGYSDWEIYHG